MGMNARAEVHFVIDQALANMRALEQQAIQTGQTLGTAFSGSQSELDSLYQSLNVVGRNFTIAGAAITGFFGFATKSAMDFEVQISAVGAVSNASSEQLEKLRENALKVGADTTFSATEVAAAMEILAKAGMNLEDIYGGVAEGAVRLSEATGTNIVTSAETAAAAMTVFRLSAEETDRVMNVIAQSANASMLDVSDWTTALQYAAPVVATLGYSIEDLAHMMVILGDSGIRGSVAATSIRNMLLQISQSSSKATAGLQSYGIAVSDASGNMRPLNEILTDLVPAWNDLNDAARVDLANEWFGPRGGPAFLNMMNAQAEAVNRGGDAFEEAGIKMGETGDIYSMSAKRMDNLAGAVERLRGSFDTLMILIGNALTPGLRFLAERLDWIVDAMASLPKPVIAIIAHLGALAGVLLTVSGTALLMLPRILEMQAALARLGGMSGVVRILGASFRSLRFAGPAMILLALAVGGVVAYQKNLFGFKTVVDGLVSVLRTMGNIVATVLTPAIAAGKAALDAMRLIFMSLPEPVKDFLSTLGNAVGLVTMIGGAIAIAVPQIAALIAVFRGMSIVPGIISGITTAFNLMRVAMLAVFANPILLAAMAVMAGLIVAYQTNFLGFGDAVDSVVGKLKRFFDLSSTKNFNVTVTFDGDAYYLTETTLPDGTKLWEVKEKDTGETFGTLLQSYTDYDGNTWIEISPKDGGASFWTTVDLMTGDIGDAYIDVHAQFSDPGSLSVRAITMEDGTTKTMVINADGRPVGEVIATLEENGEKKLVIKASGGDEFLADVDEITGKITAVQIPLEADVHPLQKASNAMFDWLNEKGAKWSLVFQGLIDMISWDHIKDTDVFEWITDKIDGLRGVIDSVISGWNTLMGLLGMGKDDGPDMSVVDQEMKQRNPSAYTAEQRQNILNGPHPTIGGATMGDFVDTVAWQATIALFTGVQNAMDGVSGSSEKLKSRTVELEGANTVFSQMLGDAVIPAILDTERNLQMVASTVPMFGQGMFSTALQARDAGGSMQATLRSVADSASSESSRAQRMFSGNTSTMMSDGRTAFQSIASTASSESSKAATSFTSNIDTMNTNVAGKFLGMRLNTAITMALMASDATTQGGNISSNMGSGITANAAKITGSLTAIRVSIALAGATAASSAYTSGANISASFANGMYAYMYKIEAAATQMAASADAAVRARARIASPSKMSEYWADMIGVGFVDKLESYQKPAANAAQALISTPSIDMSTFDMVSGGGYRSPSSIGASAHGNITVNNNYITIPPDAWEKLNSTVAASARYVEDWQQSDAIAQYLGG